MQVFQREGGVGLRQQGGGQTGGLFSGQRAGAGIRQTVGQTRAQRGRKAGIRP
ncbi:MAG: hypothetical protein ACLS7Z_10345 [Christensenellales bacterium]